MFCAIVLVTGPLWARKAWGTYWTWDPRLTTTLLIGMIYVAYLLLRNLGATGEAERRFAAGLGLLGGALMPIIHYSVQLWRGQHPTVITAKGGGLHPDMRPGADAQLCRVHGAGGPADVGARAGRARQAARTNARARCRGARAVGGGLVKLRSSWLLAPS